MLKASHTTIAEDLPYVIGELTQQADAALHSALLEMPRLHHQAEEWKWVTKLDGTNSNLIYTMRVRR